MDYESFKVQLSSMLSDGMTVDQVLASLDSVARSFSIQRKGPSQLLHDAPEALRYFIAAKDVEEKSKRTLKLYRSVLSSFFASVRKPIASIDTKDIRDYISNCRTSKHHAVVTVSNTRRILNGFFEWCVLEQLIQINPVRRITAIKVGKSPRHAMKRIELEYLRNSCTSLREKALIDFLYSTGTRVTELCNARLDNIDWEKKTLLIEHGKGDVTRFTYLNPEAEVSLKAYIASRSDDSPYIFTRSRGRSAAPLDARSVQNAVDRIVQRSGKRFSVRITPHVFRHTIATVLLRNGMPVEQVQRFLGHANINTTMVYAEVSDDDVRHSHFMYAA